MRESRSLTKGKIRVLASGSLGGSLDKWSLWSLCGASLIAQLVKNLPAMQETLVPFLGGEDPLEKGKATHSSILA